MKLSLGKRILMFAHWLLSLLACAALAVSLIAPDFYAQLRDTLHDALGRRGAILLGAVLLAIYLALVVWQVLFIFRRSEISVRNERGFIIVESSETGNVRISVAAIEQLVRQSVHTIDGIADMKIGIESMDDAIGITLNTTIYSGAHVPTVTANMQRSIRRFVEMNCGVPVRKVSISVNSVAKTADNTRRRFGRRAENAKNDAAENPMAIEPAESDVSHAPEETGTQDMPAYQEQTQASFRETEDAGEAPAEADVTEAVDEAPAETGMTEAVEEIAVGEDEEPSRQYEPYDIDKPYVSNFARELAEMKAAESMASGESGEATEVPDEA